MTRASWVPWGLVLSASVILFFAWGGLNALATYDKVFLTFEGSALLIAAAALRDWPEFPSEGSAAFGFGVFALAEVVHLLASLGMPLLPLLGFVVYVVGAVMTAVGAMRWWRSAQEGGVGVQWIRLGMALVGASYLFYVVLGFAGQGPSVAVTLLTLVGVIGAALTALALDPSALGTSEGTFPAATQSA